jgi:enamine deaminase RidA (YjgF/YER057c/UK114 family)
MSAESSPEQKLEELKIELPKANPPLGSFIFAVRTGNLVYISGQIPKKGDEILHKGKLGKDVTIEQGQEAARQCVLNSLTHIRNEIGSLGFFFQLIDSCRQSVQICEIDCICCFR